MREPFLACLLLGITVSATAQTATPSAPPGFQAAKVLSAAGISAVCIGVGTVVLNVLDSETGAIQDIEVRRDAPCYTRNAIASVKTWKFSPAMVDGNPIASRVPVAVTFESNYGPPPDPIVLPKLVPQSDAAVQSAFQPAEVLRAADPRGGIPGYTVSIGTSVLEVSLSKSGQVDDVKMILEVKPFAALAMQILPEWKFMPATLNGKPVRSKIILAFVAPYVPPPPPPNQ